MIHSLVQDFRHGIRALAADPGFVALAVLCLALGIGLNTMVFTIVNATLLEPPPLPDADRLIAVSQVRRDNPAAQAGMSLPVLRELQATSGAAIELAAVRPRGFTLAGEAPAERVVGAYVTWNLFALLGIQPLAGRTLIEDDDRPGAAPVVLLGESLWRERFAGDAAVIGRGLLIDGRMHTVIGVLPRTAHPGLPAALRAGRLWTPLVPRMHDRPDPERSLAVFARLARDMTPEAAVARMNTAFEASTASADHRDWRIAVHDFTYSFSSYTQSALAITMGAVSFVLAIACANVANLMLARGLGRRREVAIRVALGASRGRIVRQLLVESVIIGLLSVPPGLLLASLGLDWILRTAPEQASALMLSFNRPVLAFTIGLALLASVVFGLAPALHAVRDITRAGLGSSPETTSGRSHRRLRSILIVGQVALSVTLLIGATLFVRSFLNLLRIDDAFDPSPLLTLHLQLPERDATPEANARRVDEVLTRIRALPEVVAAAAASATPLRSAGTRATVLEEGADGATAGGHVILHQGISTAYFETLAVPLLRGRGFIESEVMPESSVAIVNERMAQQLWPGADALGQRFRLLDDGSGTWHTVIGIARDLSNWDLSNRPLPSAYLPLARDAVAEPRLLIRGASDPLRLATAVRKEIAAIDPALAVFELGTMSEVHRAAFWRQELLGLLFTVFGVVAILLAATGLYGVLSHLAAQRVREIGIRVALGAARRDVMRLILRQGLVLVGAGVLLGLAGGVAVNRAMRRLLYAVDATDPLTFVAVAVLVAVIGLIASYVPARRAALGDPNVSLRA